MLNTSILEDVKNQVLSAVDPEDTEYDQAIITAINASFAKLRIAGCGPVSGFVINGYEETWGDFIDKDVLCAQPRQYVIQSVTLSFSPPDNATVVNLLKESLQDLLVLINHESEYYDLDDEEAEDEELYRTERKNTWKERKAIFHPKTTM